MTDLARLFHLAWRYDRGGLIATACAFALPWIAAMIGEIM